VQISIPVERAISVDPRANSWLGSANHDQECTAGVGMISCLVLQKGKKEIPARFPTSGWRRALIRTPNGKKR